MENIESINTQFRVVLEERASSLTQGHFAGPCMEGKILMRCPFPYPPPPPKPPKK